MSVKVEAERLRDEVGRFGSTPYLLTVSDDQRPHAVSVAVAWDGDELVAATGDRTAGNAAARPDVSLLWPPHEPGGYSLIVDGTATVEAGDGGSRVRVRPGRAVLHRSAPGTAPGSYEADCERLPGA